MSDPIHGGNVMGDVDSSFMTSDADTPNTRHVTINGGGTRWQGLRDTDADEEAYFNASDGEDDDEDELSRDGPPTPMSHIVNGASPLSKPLVDYADDDDDEEDDLPPIRPTSFSPLQEKQKHSGNSGASDPLSSPSPITPTSLAASPKTPKIPPPSLAEKRRREEDDDDEDELGKLSAQSTAKRRNSSVSAPNLTGISIAKGGSAGSPNPAPKDVASVSPATNAQTPPPRQGNIDMIIPNDWESPPEDTSHTLPEPQQQENSPSLPQTKKTEDEPPTSTPMTRSGTLRKRKAFNTKDVAAAAANDAKTGVGAGGGVTVKKIVFNLGGGEKNTPTVGDAGPKKGGEK